ncbi:hypothetical protein D3C87_1093740 [compost metagenome]
MQLIFSTIHYFLSKPRRQLIPSIIERIAHDQCFKGILIEHICICSTFIFWKSIRNIFTHFKEFVEDFGFRCHCWCCLFQFNRSKHKGDITPKFCDPEVMPYAQTFKNCFIPLPCRFIFDIGYINICQIGVNASYMLIV